MLFSDLLHPPAQQPRLASGALFASGPPHPGGEVVFAEECFPTLFVYSTVFGVVRARTRLVAFLHVDVIYAGSGLRGHRIDPRRDPLDPARVALEDGEAALAAEVGSRSGGGLRRRTVGSAGTLGYARWNHSQPFYSGEGRLRDSHLPEPSYVRDCPNGSRSTPSTSVPTAGLVLTGVVL